MMDKATFALQTHCSPAAQHAEGISIQVSPQSPWKVIPEKANLHSPIYLRAMRDFLLWVLYSCLQVTKNQGHQLLPRANPDFILLGGLGYPSCWDREDFMCLSTNAFGDLHIRSLHGNTLRRVFHENRHILGGVGRMCREIGNKTEEGWMINAQGLLWLPGLHPLL